jgi:hypothetical protein
VQPASDAIFLAHLNAKNHAVDGNSPALAEGKGSPSAAAAQL